MREGDWRIATKALYILHRVSANGAPEQAPNFQMRWVRLLSLVCILSVCSMHI